MNFTRLFPYLVFTVLNFGGLAVGSFFTGPGVASTWYEMLPTAPWTPPGWVFGAAWTTVMIGFSWFMGSLWNADQATSFRQRTMKLFAVSWVCNVAWNPLFFYAQAIEWALVVITALYVVLFVLMRHSFSAPSPHAGKWGILPYVLWLTIAISLNAYPVFVA